MATQPLGHDSPTVTLPGTIPPMPAVARILARHDRGKVEAFISIAIDLLDVLDGDAEAEENPLEDAFATHDPAFTHMDSDGRDTSWPEWHTRGRHKLARGVAEMSDSMIHEDAEDDDPDTGIEDSPEGFDPEEDLAVDDAPCDGDDDAEIEQMSDDVPMLPVVSAGHDIFTDRRPPLGISNLQSSFRTGSEVRSADSGAAHRSVGDGCQPGQPV